jgi:hypothetical protein
VSPVARLLGVAGTLAVLGACCPIPLKRQVSVRPELTVTVADADGAPVAHAAVLVRRITNGPPPTRETHHWTTATDATGTVVLDAIEESETYLPLMMHGVEWYAWEVCVRDTRGVGTAQHSGRTPVEPPVVVPITLDPGRTDCEWETLPEHL